jgi:hypothetical protein
VDNFVAQRQNATNGNEIGANDEDEEKETKFRDIYNRHVKTVSFVNFKIFGLNSLIPL